MNVTVNSCTAEKPYGFEPRLKVLYVATELIIAMVTVIGNSLVCLAVAHNKKLRTVTNYFLVSLAVADILVGSVAVPCAVMTDLGRPRHDLSLCLVTLSILMMLTQSSILSLLAVAAERYVAILLPFQYERMMSPRNAQLALLLTWSLGAVTGSVPLMDQHRQPANSNYCVFTCVVNMSYMVYFNFFCCLLLPLAAMFIIYGHIFLTVRRQLRRIAVVGGNASRTEDTVSSGVGGTTGSKSDLQLSTENKKKCTNAGALVETETTTVYPTPGFRITPTTLTTPITLTTPTTPTNKTGFCDESRTIKSNTRTRRREQRKATSLFLVLFLFTLCWTPIHLIHCVLLLCPRCHVPTALTLAAILLSHANSALNPLLYAYRMRSFRQTVTGMWRGIWNVPPKHR